MKTRQWKFSNGLWICVILAGLGRPVFGVQNVTLAWDPSTDPGVTGYKLYYGSAPGAYTATNDVGSVTNAVVPSLIEGFTYYFAVTAYNSSGLESAFSNELVYTVPNPALQTWQTQYFSSSVLANSTLQTTVWGDMADADHDGRSNLQAYALGLNPLGQTDNNTGLSATVRSGTGGQYQTFTFNRRKSDASLVYVPQVSGDKQNWSSSSSSVVPVATNAVDASFDAVTYQDLTPVTASQPRFFALSISRYSNGVAVATSTSETYVASATTILGKTTSASQLTYFGLRMVQPTVAGGTVTALGANSLTDANANWSNGQFNGANGSFYVEFANGLIADITNTDPTTHTLSLPGDVRAAVSVGDAYKIRRHSTLADVFGPNNEAGLTGGGNPAAADNVVLLDDQTQNLQMYFYCNVSGYTGWYSGSFQPANNVVVYPEQGVVVSRKTAGSMARYISGVCKTGPTLAPISPGLNLLGTVHSVAGMTLSSLNLYTGNPATGLVGGSNPAAADNLVIPSATGMDLYFYCNVPGYLGWYDGAFNPAGNKIVPPGSAFYIKRKAPNAAFNWIIPGE